MADHRNTTIIDIDDIKSLWRSVYKNWYIVAACLGLSYAVAFFYTYRLTDVYAASMQILLKSNDLYDSKSLIQSQGAMSPYMNYQDNYNATRVIRSFDLVKKTVDKLKLDVSYFIKGRIRTKEVYDALPFEIVPDNINPMLYSQKINFKILDRNNYEISYIKGGQQITKKGRFDTDLVSSDLQILVKRSSSLNKVTEKQLSEVAYLIQFHNRNSLVTRYQAGLNVEVPEFTGILQITLEDIIPARAVAFLDTLGRVYIENTVTSKLEVNSRTLSYIDMQLEELTGMMTSIEDKLQNYKQKEAILDLNREQENFFEQLVELQSQQTKIDMQISALTGLQNYIIEGKDPELLPPNFIAIQTDQFLERSVNELYNTQVIRNSSLYSITSKGPIIDEIDQKLERMKSDLLVYLNNSKKAARDQRAEIDKKITQVSSKIGNIPMLQRELLNIERNLEVNQKMYSFLLERKAENTISRAGIVPESKIIESARSLGVVKPNKSRITYSFLGAGFILGMLIIFIRTTFYETIDNIDFLKQKTSFPILGEIVYLKEQTGRSPILAQADPRSLITESFRSIRTNLQFMTSEGGSKVYLFTSNNPGEGKTFCSVNLAILLAKTGKKVLLLEFDLHQPRVHQALDVTNDIGLTSILIGKATPSECVVKTSIENLDVILSGPSPPNASELILHKEINLLFDYAKENYDFVLVDTPPIGFITDARILMRYADVSMFVINSRLPYRESLANAHETAESRGNCSFTFILNGVKRTRSRYYSKRYGYGYGYGYGTGYGSKEQSDTKIGNKDFKNQL